MIETIWQDILTAQDRWVIEHAGYRTRGASTFASRGTLVAPALLIIDMQPLFVGDDVPIYEAIETEPTMIGERGWRAIDAMQPLIGTFRSLSFPVFYAQMLPRNRDASDPLLSIVDAIAPEPGDTVIQKRTSSTFYETRLAEKLHERDVESLVIVGNSTSGCIRAAAVDAVQYGFSVFVPHDCVFDRIEASHKSSLLDMWMKYATITAASAINDEIRLLAREAQP